MFTSASCSRLQRIPESTLPEVACPTALALLLGAFLVTAGIGYFVFVIEADIYARDVTTPVVSVTSAVDLFPTHDVAPP